MAQSGEEKNILLGHLMVSIFCLILAIIFFGMSSITEAYLYVGIFCITLALSTIVVYFTRKRCCPGSTCWCCTGRDPHVKGFCNICCDICLRCMCCADNDRRRMTQEEARARYLLRQRSLRSGFVESSTPNPPPLTADEMHSIRRLESQILDIKIELTHALLDNELQTNAERDFAELLKWYLETENKTLNRWIEGYDRCSHSEMERMERRLNGMQRRWRLQGQGSFNLRLIMRDPSVQRWQRRSHSWVRSLRRSQRRGQPPPAPPMPNFNISDRTSPQHGGLEVRLPPEIPQPPSYHAATSTLTTVSSQDNDISLPASPPSYEESETAMKESQSSAREGESYRILTSYSSQPEVQTVMLASPEDSTLGPPTDETDAPPTYEEASSTSV